MSIKITWDDVNGFEDYLKSTARDDLTIRSYLASIKKFKEFLEQNTFENWEKAVVSYLAKLNETGSQPSTLKHAYAVIRVFAHYKKIVEILSMKQRWARSTKLPRVLSSDKRKLVELEAVKLGAELGEPYLHIAVMMMTRMGLRIGEVVKLKTSQVNLNEWTIRIRGKGKKDAVLPIPNAMKNHIKTAMKMAGGENLFPYTKVTLWRRIKVIGERIGMPDLKPHMLRHTFATELLKKGVNIRAVQKFLRHSSLATTQVYTHLSVEDLREEINKISWDK